MQKCHVNRLPTFDGLISHEIMDNVLYAVRLDCLSNCRRQILIDDSPRGMRKSLLKGEAHMADATTNVNKEWGFGRQTVTEFLLKGIDIEKYLLPLAIGHHPLEKIGEARRYRKGPIKGQ